jgi:hypothetical protein
MIITDDSHLDHGLTQDQVAYILDRFGDREGFFIESFTLPEELGTVQSALYGPAAGDEPIREEDVFYKTRGGRSGMSRMIDAAPREQRRVTVIAGPHEGATILYTAYGGPLAPREPFDVLNEPDTVQRESNMFWVQHALSAQS